MEYFPKGKGQCRVCLKETEEKAYILCVPCCQAILKAERELRRMGMFDIDKDLYIKWHEEKSLAIEKIEKREEIEARILELSKIEFFAKAEGMLLSQRWDKISGRHGIPAWIKAERNALITDPNIKVNWDGEPREKKPKKEKVDYLGMLGINTRDLDEQLKGKGKPPQGEKPKKEKPMSMQDAIQLMITPAPKETKPEFSDDEKKAKADAIKEKIRLAKEAREKKE